MSIPVFIVWLVFWAFFSPMVGIGVSIVTGSQIAGIGAVVLFTALAAFCTVVLELFLKQNR
jgi:hypothetical protein